MTIHGTDGMSLQGQIGKVYQGLFVKGFDKNEIAKRKISIGFDQRIFIQCLNDTSKIQVNSISKDGLETLLELNTVGNEDKNKIKELFDIEKMSNQEIKEKCVLIRPYMAGMFENWSGSTGVRLDVE